MALNDQALTFGDVTSSDYGIYIGGEGVFDAPKRRTKVVEIPGRNGDFAQDLGSFENIPVRYPAFYKAPDLATFAEDIAAFRAALASQIGYQRLTDTIHPDQYRMGLFIDGLEVKPLKDDTIATFDIIFNCKPQRWLTSGETAQTVASGDTITNPTLFASQPIIEAEGYGTISLAGQTISVANNPLGEIQAAPSQTLEIGAANSGQIQLFESAEAYASQVNTGDTITLGASKVEYGGRGAAVEVTGATGDGSVVANVAQNTYYAIVQFPALTFTAGTARTYNEAFTLTVTVSGGFTQTYNVTVSIAYDGNRTLTFTRTWWTPTYPYFSGDTPPFEVGAVTVNSTVTPDVSVIIDLEKGTAQYSDGADANNNVALPAELPTIPAGDSTITYSNTFSAMAITPRWWTI